jgi:DNA-binding transcriptional regulator YhcF (GntR family)
MNMVVDFTKYRHAKSAANKGTRRISVREMAKDLSVHPETIRRYVRQNRVPEECFVRDMAGHIWIDPIAFIAALPGVEESG